MIDYTYTLEEDVSELNRDIDKLRGKILKWEEMKNGWEKDGVREYKELHKNILLPGDYGDKFQEFDEFWLIVNNQRLVFMALMITFGVR